MVDCLGVTGIIRLLQAWTVIWKSENMDLWCNILRMADHFISAMDY